MKILLPVDGSACADKTLAWVAKTFNKQAEYHLIFVLPIVTDFPVVETSLAEATSLLHQAQCALEKQGCRVVNAEYLLGLPVDRICRYAESKDVDLVVIGSHGRTGLAKLLMGSVGEGVLEHCKRPVVIFKNKVDVQAEQPAHGHPFSHTVL